MVVLWESEASVWIPGKNREREQEADWWNQLSNYRSLKKAQSPAFDMMAFSIFTWNVFTLLVYYTELFKNKKNKDELESVGKIILFYNDTIKVHN